MGLGFGDWRSEQNGDRGRMGIGVEWGSKNMKQHVTERETCGGMGSGTGMWMNKQK